VIRHHFATLLSLHQMGYDKPYNVQYRAETVRDTFRGTNEKMLNPVKTDTERCAILRRMLTTHFFTPFPGRMDRLENEFLGLLDTHKLCISREMEQMMLNTICEYMTPERCQRFEMHASRAILFMLVSNFWVHIYEGMCISSRYNAELSRKRRAEAQAYCRETMLRYPFLLVALPVDIDVIDSQDVVDDVFFKWLMEECKSAEFDWMSDDRKWWNHAQPETLASACILTNDRLHLARLLVTHGLFIERVEYKNLSQYPPRNFIEWWDNAIDLLLLSGLCNIADLRASFSDKPNGITTLGQHLVQVIIESEQGSITQASLAMWALEEVPASNIQLMASLVHEIVTLLRNCWARARKAEDDTEKRYVLCRLLELYSVQQLPRAFWQSVPGFEEWMTRTKPQPYLDAAAKEDVLEVSLMSKDRLPAPKWREVTEWLDEYDTVEYQRNMTLAHRIGRKSWIAVLQAYRDAHSLAAAADAAAAAAPMPMEA
jgi:hypothetical protein